MPDSKRNVIVFCEDEENCYSDYLKIARQLGLKAPYAPTDPKTLTDIGLEDGQVFLFKNYRDADEGLKTLMQRNDCRITMLIMDQVLDPHVQTYVSQHGRFGSALIEKYHVWLQRHKTKTVLRTAEEGDITHIFEGLQNYLPDLSYVLKRTDSQYKTLIAHMIPQIARATGMTLAELQAREKTIDIGPSAQAAAPIKM